MSKAAILALNPRSGKWEASYAGRVIVQSPDKKYIKHVIAKGLNGRARELGVTKVEELGSPSVEGQPPVPMVEFDVNERFEFLEAYVDMVAQRQMKSVVIVGEGGLGKSYTVMQRLAHNGLKQLDIHSEDFEVGATANQANSSTSFVVVKGYSTAKGLYRTLFENRNRLVVFDDCDAVLENDTASDILKAALDSYDRRIVTWNAESFGESDLPKSFEFTGTIIFISNKPMHKVPQPILSRSAPADVSMSRAEILARMKAIAAKEEFMPDTPKPMLKDVLEFLAEHINNPQVKALSLRTLMKVAINRQHKPDIWKRLSLAMMIAER